MIEVRNTLFQPLSFQLRGGAGLHLGPRERRKIREDQLSPELEKAGRRGQITITKLIPQAAAPTDESAAATPASSGPEPSSIEADAEPNPTTSRKRR